MSYVVFTADPRIETEEILCAAREWTGRKIYAHSKSTDVSFQRGALSGFQFLPIEDTLDARNSWLFERNSPADFFVIKNPRVPDIMDRAIAMHQIQLKGQKLVVEEHPFLGKADVFWLYFPYSFIDKLLLGYPHSYAFRDSREPGAFDVARLAGRVRGATRNYLPHIYADDIATIRVALSPDEHREYAELKDRLFETENTPGAIIRKLKAFVDGTYSMTWAAGRGKHLSLLALNRMWGSYKAGIRTRVVSDAKVDLYLASQMDAYIANANGFIQSLGCQSNG